MTRIATNMVTQNLLLDLQKSQARLADISGQTASQTRADDVKGYGEQSQTLVSSNRIIARLEHRVSRNEELGTRLSIQETSLERAGEVVNDLRQTLVEAVGLDTGDFVVSKLQETFNALKDSMNSNLNGNYLFGGTLTDKPPVTVGTVSDLAALPTVADAFETNVAPPLQEVRLDAIQTANVAPSAFDVLQDAFAAIQSLQDFHENTGAFSGPLSDAQRTELQTQMARLSTSYENMIAAQGENGRVSKLAEDASARQNLQINSLRQSVGDIRDVDLAEVAVQLNQAQLSFEASASVFNSLRNLSLLNFLN